MREIIAGLVALLLVGFGSLAVFGGEKDTPLTPAEVTITKKIAQQPEVFIFRRDVVKHK